MLSSALAALVNQQCALAQSSVVLIVDTLVPKWLEFQPYQASDSNAGRFNARDYGTSNHENDSLPNYVGTFTKDPTMPLHLPLDDNGGELVLRPSLLPPHDTIRISRYEVLGKCFRDTTYTTISYFKPSDTGPALKRVKHHKKPGKKAECLGRTDEMTLLINARSYKVPLMVVSSEAFPFSSIDRCRWFTGKSDRIGSRPCNLRSHRESKTFTWYHEASLTLP